MELRIKESDLISHLIELSRQDFPALSEEERAKIAREYVHYLTGSSGSAKNPEVSLLLGLVYHDSKSRFYYYGNNLENCENGKDMILPRGYIFPGKRE